MQKISNGHPSISVGEASIYMRKCLNTQTSQALGSPSFSNTKVLFLLWYIYNGKICESTKIYSVHM